MTPRRFFGLAQAALLVLAFTVASTRFALAATKFESQEVKPGEVPAAVKTSHDKRYAKAKTKWRRNSWSNDRGKQTTVYVGWFFHEKKAHRAAYTPEGKGYLTIRYLGGAAGLPDVVKNAATAAHPGMRIAAAQQYEAFTLNMTAFRVQLAKGATKVVTWLDKDGNPISKDNLPDAIEELGS